MSFARSARSALGRPAASFHRLPIRMRLALVSTAMTFVILCAFAAIVGDVTVNRIRSDFYRQVSANATELAAAFHAQVQLNGSSASIVPNLSDIGHNAQIRLLSLSGTSVQGNRRPLAPVLDRSGHLIDEINANGFRVDNRALQVTLPDGSAGTVVLQYGRALSQIQPTIARVRLLLLLGVLFGTGLAMLGGLMIARRAMRQIARLTGTAREIARTRDPRRRVPEPDADDEVAELARTFDEMLRGLDAARRDTEAALARQRQFVADASHELRTPLTSVLANLELLADSLGGEEGDAARSALRSTKRMRRLVADLLLLARSDVGHAAPFASTDLSQLVTEAAAELEPIVGDHTIVVDADRSVVISGVHDELLRLVLNLIENAVRHTPPGSTVWVRTATGDRDEAIVEVEDDGPGIPQDLADTLFERFVRGDSDRGGSSGLGLAIVRAVAESHGGIVSLQPRAQGRRGARFVVRLPTAQREEAPAPTGPPTVESPAALLPAQRTAPARG